MTLPAPRIIVIDDNPDHLRSLTGGLNTHGVACLPIHFTGDDAGVPRCPQVRVIFADLHLNEAGAATDNARHFTVIGGLLEETVVPAGPYAIVLWTRYADQADALRQFLEERLRLVPKPFAVIPLDKKVHLNADNSVRDSKALVDAISGVLTAQPQLAALFNWEERVLGASAAAVSAVIDLATADTDPAGRAHAVGQLLFHLALEAAGAGNVEADRFRAVNDALLPILADHVASLRADADAELWEVALRGQSADAGMSSEEAARLNRMMHIASGAGVLPSERGAVLRLPDEKLTGFEAVFGMAQEPAATRQFGCKAFALNDARFSWRLLQVQAVCDYAQRQPGPLPFVLGLEMPASAASTSSLPAAITPTPWFELESVVRVLHVNARFQISLPRADVDRMAVEYRLRESLLNLMGYQLHSYGARPGIVAFREKKAKAAKAAAPPAPSAQPHVKPES
jgi:hypothetical protein